MTRCAIWKKGGALLLGALVVASFSIPFLAQAQQGDAPPAGTPPPQGGAPVPSTPTPPGTPTEDTNPRPNSDIYGPIGEQILRLFAYFTGLAGLFLNVAIYYLVVKMGAFVDGLGVILIAWRVLRDVGNIVLIFGFVAIGIATILDVQSYNAKKMLVKLIIVAVTVNFSLFAARAIIDVGNVFSYQFYQQITSPERAGGESGWNPADEGVSNAIMNAVGLTKFYDASGKQIRDVAVLQANWFPALIFGSLLFIVAAFVLLTLAFILISRFVILVFLMIFAPIGFIGLVVPMMEKTAKQWWTTLISQSLVAPILILLLLISIKTIEGSNLTSGGFGALLEQGASADSWLATISLILGFFLAMGMLMASVIIAKQAGAFGAGFAIGASRRIVGTALSPITAPSVWASRKGLNWAGDRYEKTGLGRAVRKIPLAGAFLDEKFAGAAGGIKNIKVAGKTQADRDKEIKHREHEVSQLNAIQKLKASSDDERAQLLHKMSKADIVKYLEGASKEERAKIGASLSAERFADIMKDEKVDHNIQHDLSHGRYAGTENDLNTIHKSSDTNRVEAATESLKRKAKTYTVRDLEHMPAEMLVDPALVNALSESQVEEITKSSNNNVASAIKERIKTIRNERFATTESSRAAFKSMTDEQITKLDGAVLRQPDTLKAMNAAALIAVLQAKNVGQETRSTVANYIVNAVNDPSHAESAALAAHARGNPIVAQQLGMEQAPLTVTIASGNAGASPQQQRRAPLTPGSRAGERNRPV